MEKGKSYKQQWVLNGCPRTAFFEPEEFTKAGDARGAYVDADGKKYKRVIVKREDFGLWQPA